MEGDNMFEALFTDDQTRETITETYDKWAKTYDKDVVADLDYQIHCFAAEGVEQHCPVTPKDAIVLDVGCGTGLVGEQLKERGFEHIDGIEPSPASIKLAKEKRLYRNLYCQYFTKDPLDIPRDTYDVIVTGGAFIRGHLPYDCLHEMVRLVRPVISRWCPLVAVRTYADYLGAAPPEHYAADTEHSIPLSHIILTLNTIDLPLSIIAGGIICIVSRYSSFDNKTVPEYKDHLVPLMQELEQAKKWKKRTWETVPQYLGNVKGLRIVYDVL